MIGENLFMIVDTFSGTNSYNKKGIFVYNTTPPRNTNALAYTLQDGDRGI